MINAACPVCLGDNVEEVDTKFGGSVTSDGKYLKYNIVQKYCRSCGYIYIDESDRFDLYKFYKKEYEFLLDSESIERMVFDKKNSTYSDYKVTFFSDFLQNDSKKKFLDIGAGKGNFVRAVNKSFPKIEISALEPSKSFNLLVRNKFIKFCHNKFFSSHDFKNYFFDYISLSEVLEHVFNPRLFLEDVKNIMNDNSLLMISVPNVENDKYDFISPDHISRFVNHSAENLFKKVGLEIVKIDKIENSSSMLFIVRKGKKSEIDIYDPIDIINNSIGFIKKAIEDARRIKDQKVAVYGQGLILNYLIGQGIFTADNVVCIIDDNLMYNGKKWKNMIDILGPNDFIKVYDNLDNIFLAMNECYHKLVISRLSKKYKIFGTDLNRYS